MPSTDASFYISGKNLTQAKLSQLYNLQLGAIKKHPFSFDHFSFFLRYFMSMDCIMKCVRVGNSSHTYHSTQNGWNQPTQETPGSVWSERKNVRIANLKGNFTSFLTVTKYFVVYWMKNLNRFLTSLFLHQSKSCQVLRMPVWINFQVSGKEGYIVNLIDVC